MHLQSTDCIHHPQGGFLFVNYRQLTEKLVQYIQERTQYDPQTIRTVVLTIPAAVRQCLKDHGRAALIGLFTIYTHNELSINLTESFLQAYRDMPDTED